MLRGFYVDVTPRISAIIDCPVQGMLIVEESVLYNTPNVHVGLWKDPTMLELLPILVPIGRFTLLCPSYIKFVKFCSWCAYPTDPDFVGVYLDAFSRAIVKPSPPLSGGDSPFYVVARNCECIIELIEFYMPYNPGIAYSENQFISVLPFP